MRSMTFTVVGVVKPLCSVKKLMLAGNTAVFDDEGCYMYDKGNGDITRLREEEGNFMLDVWIPPPSVAESAGFQRRP